MFNQVGSTEPFRARLPGLAAMWLPPAGGPKRECVAVPPAVRMPCGVPPFDPAHCRAQGCCYGPFSPDPHSYPWCYAQRNTTSRSCSDRCQAAVPVPATPQTWADQEALDMAAGVFLRRKKVVVGGDGDINVYVNSGPSSSSCSVSVEQRTYAHRSRRQLLVTEFEVDATCCKQLHGGLTLTVQAGESVQDAFEAGVADFNWTVHGGGGGDGITAMAGATLIPEQGGRQVGVGFATVAPMKGQAMLRLAAGQITTHSFPTAFASDVDADALGSLAALATNASDELMTAVQLGPAALLAEHTAAMQREHASRTEVVGDIELARLVNATAYALGASLVAGIEWSTSPGGLSTGGRITADGRDTHGGGGYPEGGSSYYGHVFWDGDVWMLPAMLPLRPGVVRSMVAYRSKTMAAAVANARSQSLNGTKWVWESAFAGTSAVGGACQEVHLQAGIGMAIRQYFRATQDIAWLRTTAWPMVLNIVSFFESRATLQWTRNCVTFNATEIARISRCVAAGGGDIDCDRSTCTNVSGHVFTGGNTAGHPGCGICHCCSPGLADPAQPANALGINGVESPNEYASGIDNDIYTNAAFATFLEWVGVAARLLGESDAARYTELGQRIIIPFNRTAGRHEEYTDVQ